MDAGTDSTPPWRKSQTKTYSRHKPMVQSLTYKTSKEKFADVHHAWLMDKILKRPVHGADKYRRPVQDISNRPNHAGDGRSAVQDIARKPEVITVHSGAESRSENDLSRRSSKLSKSQQPGNKPRNKPLRRPEKRSDKDRSLVLKSNSPSVQRFEEAKSDVVFAKPTKWRNKDMIFDRQHPLTEIQSTLSVSCVSNLSPVNMTADVSATLLRSLALSSTIMTSVSRRLHEKQTSTPVNSSAQLSNIRSSRFEPCQSIILPVTSMTPSPSMPRLSVEAYVPEITRLTKRQIRDSAITVRRSSAAFQTDMSTRCYEYASMPRLSHVDAIDESLSTDVSKLSFLKSANNSVMRQKLLEICEQSAPETFSKYFSESALSTCFKIGEGTYGEVFAVDNDGRLEAVKVICFEGKVRYNGMNQSTCRNLLIEVVIAQNLCNLRIGTESRCSTFMNVYGIHCVQGRYPVQMIQKWEEANEKKSSANDNPKIVLEDQLFVTLIGEYCGTCLEDYKGLTPAQACSVLWQLSVGLAVAETTLEFEHRDLHGGNIMLESTDEKEIEFVVNGIKLPVPTCSLRVVIIDYSLSRMVVDDRVMYVDLSQEEDLFTGSGLQYQVYRDMRKVNGNDWKKFNPITNIQWLTFVGHLMEKQTRASTSRRHDRYQLREDARMLRQTIEQIRCCTSATNYVSSYYMVLNVGPSIA